VKISVDFLTFISENCTLPPSITNGYFVVSNSTAAYHCNNGYIANQTNNVIHCNNSLWEQIHLCCTGTSNLFYSKIYKYQNMPLWHRFCTFWKGESWTFSAKFQLDGYYNEQFLISYLL
jgi:hypothetical protein